MFRVKDGVLVVMPANADKEEFFRIIHVDDHNLVYELDNQTNSMSR
jgi:hypothetical protein